MAAAGGHVGSIKALTGKPEAAAAQETLERLARETKHIMVRHGWNISSLVEFKPKKAGLLGMNVNKSKVLVRLRRDDDSFLPFESCLGTMLHELVHMDVGPHSAQFYALLDQVHDEYDKGEAPAAAVAPSFQGRGKALGAASYRAGPKGAAPRDRRRAQLAAAERRRQFVSSRQVLGSGSASGSGMRGSDAAHAALTPKEKMLLAAEPTKSGHPSKQKQEQPKKQKKKTQTQRTCSPR